MKTETLYRPRGFFGDDVRGADLEARGLRIDPTHRQGEADLMRSRWFDYHDLHPVTATYLFAHRYKEQTRRFCETYIDTRTADEAVAFVPDDIFYSRDLTSMWLARRSADRLGLPYEFVLEVAQKRFVDKLFHRFPRPNQLYSEEFELDLQDEWKARLARQLVYSQRAFFRMRHWRGLVVQARHVKFVVDQIKGREGGHVNLLGRMLHEDVLSVGLAGMHFPAELVKAAAVVASRLG